MKNFSVKTADFDSLSISGESPIVQSDLGTAPNQIPLNKDLGSLAYMNAPQIEDINVDTLELREIAAELSDTAVDVFVYDTRKDSDGGAWKSRIQHTSWYNEELNTATRGSRREFPAVAVIVAEADKVTIYDGDDPDLSMWMVFNAGNENGNNMIGRITETTTSTTMLDGLMCVGRRNFGLHMINFITDSARFKESGYDTPYNLPIGTNRNGGNSWLGMNVDGNDLVDDRINDIAMTVLPDAPIDTETGLPVPTIAVATDGGVSVIKHDGNVVDITVNNASYSYAKNVNFTTNNDFITVIGGSSSHDYIFVFDGIPDSDNVMTIDSRTGSSQDARSMFRKMPLSNDTIFDGFTIGSGGSQNQMIQTIQGDRFACGNDNDGLTIIDDNDLGFKKKNLAYISSSYNTGWMPGDIKLATLSDTKIETVGVDETTELIVDGSDNWVGNFDVAADVSEWTGSGGTIDGSLGYVRITQTTNSTAYLTIPINTVVGKKYKISADIRTSVADTVNTGAAFYIGETAYQNDVALRRPMVSEGSFSSFSLEFVATTSVTHITLASWAQSGDHVEFDNVSVKQTGELITNGTFENGTEGWILSSLNAPTVSSGTLQFNNVDGSTQSHAEQEMPTVAGKKYLLSFDYVGSSTLNIYIGTSQGESQILNTSVSSSNGYSFSFVATSSSTWIRFRDNVSGTTPTIDNVSIRLAEDDRSVNNNGLQVFGEIDKTPVASGADLVAYSGFSPDNYLSIPNNSDLNFGVEDYCIIGWYKFANSTITDTETFFYRGGAGDGKYVRLVCDSSQRLIFQYNTTGGENADTSIVFKQNQITTNWEQVVIVRRNGVHSIYVNGLYMPLDPNSVGVTDYSDIKFTADLTFGVAPPPQNYDYRFKGSLALWRISKTAPTNEQIAKIYRDEKPLFQDGAQATLYGTSDAVTALAYDDSDNLLHVGTASGRSSFNGLKRVDNTTTAVSTAISATEGLVIEQ